MQRNNGKRVAGGETPPKKQRKPKRPSRLTRQQKILLAIAIVLAIAVVAVAAWKSLFVRPELPDKAGTGTGDAAGTVEEIDYGDGIRPKASGERKSEDFYTVLILGRDTGGGGNTDTMLLASYDVTNQKATVMSIPRDTMVNIPYDVKKINAVYNYGGGGVKGIKALYKEISQLLGFEPDYEVIVEWDAVGKIVDAIGGVYFDVPYDMDYHDPYQDLVIEQAKGYRLLDGDDAMQVIRWRQNDSYSPYGNIKIGDDGRIKVQQDFLKAVIKQLLTPSNIKNIGKISKVFQESVETDLSFQEILWFGKAAVSGGLGVDSVEFLTMPYQYASAFSRSYSKELGYAHYLAYVVPVASELLDIVNNKLSPFVESLKRSDLDIMYVNSNGSIGSTSGYVEDTTAAQPPDLSPYEEKPETNYELDENGNLIDPETGEIVVPAPGTGVTDPNDPGTLDPNDPGVIVPENPETDDPGTTNPETPEAPGSEPEETPAVTEPADPGPAPGEEDAYVPDSPIEPEIITE